MSAKDPHDPQHRVRSLLAHPSNHVAGRSADLSRIELTGCPECDQPAEIVDRFVLGSTDGPFEHVRIRCLLGHGFLMPVELLRDRLRS